MKRVLPIIVLAVLSASLIGQDSLVHVASQDQGSKLANSFIVPGVLMASGILLNHHDRKRDAHTFIRENLGTTRTVLDDYMQHIPLFSLILSDLISKKEKDVVKAHLSHFVVAQMVTISGTYILKWSVNARRPSGGPRSFPSGHTAYAFTGATYLFHVLRDDHPFWAHMSFVPAIATGMLRISNNRHWPSDVLFGAGLGMLVPTLFYQLKWRHKLDSSDSAYHFDIYPGGLSLKYRF